MRTKEEILDRVYSNSNLQSEAFYNAMEQYKLEFAIAIMQNVIQDLQGEPITTDIMSSFRLALSKLQTQLNQIK